MAVAFLAPELAAAIEPGAYITDGYHLFAILSVAEGRRHDPLVTYEDCRTLELLVCPVSELAQRHVELVRPAPAAATGNDQPGYDRSEENQHEANRERVDRADRRPY